MHPIWHRSTLPTREWPDGYYTIHDRPIPRPRWSRRLYRRYTAVHESGHAVAAVLLDGQVNYALAAPGDGHVAIKRWPPLIRDVLTVYAAGEQASQRWLAEAGEWSVDRAWCVEVGAATDRRLAREFSAQFGIRLGFGDGQPCDIRWAQIQADADDLINLCWPAVHTLAAQLLAVDRVDGDKIHAIAHPSQSNVPPARLRSRRTRPFARRMPSGLAPAVPVRGAVSDPR